MISTAGTNLIAQASRVQIEQRLELANRPAGWSAVAALAAALALCWLIVWLYRRERRAGASTRVRLALAAVRCVVMLALLGIWFQPVIATYLHRWIDSYTLVLVDTSSSMDLQDRYRSADGIERVAALLPGRQREPIRRSELVEKILSQSHNKFLRDLAANNRVKLYTFSDDARTVCTLRSASEERFKEVATPGSAARQEALVGSNQLASMPIDLPARGAVTNLDRALRECTNAMGQSPIAGVVILTDGGVNQGDSIEAIGHWAREHKLPLQVVGVGDSSPPQNVRVAELIAPDNVFAEDPFAIITQTRGQGVAGETFQVNLIERRADSGGPGRIVATKSVTFAQDDDVQPVTFEHRQGAVGRYVYQVNVPVGPTESIADDNTRQTVVNVIENKLRVLLIAGGPSWNYRYLSRLLQRDNTFEVSCWLQSADIDAVRDGDVVIDHLPATPEELFAYDAVIMLDPDPLELTADWCALVTELVTRHGGGLLYEAARPHAASFFNDPACGDIIKMLPITPDPDAEIVLNEIGHYQTQPYSPLIPPAAAGHPVLKLPDRDTGGVGWGQLGGVYWHYPVLREKPVATVLMRHGNPRMSNAYGRHVLAATQYVGAGRTAFLGFDGTWRWRAFGEEYFNQFWVHMIRYLVEGKLSGGNRRGMLLTESDTYQLGETVRVTARLFDPSFRPLQIDSVDAHYSMDNEKGDVVLQKTADRPGWYEGRFIPSRTGLCELTLPIPDADVGTEPARKEIQVVRPNLEIVQPRMQRESLIFLAEQSPGGHYYDVDEAGRLPSQIPDRHESTTIRSRPAPLWDRGWVLATLVGLLCVEWGLRKAFSLL